MQIVMGLWVSLGTIGICDDHLITLQVILLLLVVINWFF